MCPTGSKDDENIRGKKKKHAMGEVAVAAPASPLSLICNCNTHSHTVTVCFPLAELRALCSQQQPPTSCSCHRKSSPTGSERKYYFKREFVMTLQIDTMQHLTRLILVSYPCRHDVVMIAAVVVIAVAGEREQNTHTQRRTRLPKLLRCL